MANKCLSNEEIAARIVDIYFKEIARLGFKRTLNLDEVINAYYYTLSKLGDKEKSMAEARQKVLKEEKIIKTETTEEILPKTN
jgi:hypothetical protein